MSSPASFTDTASGQACDHDRTVVAIAWPTGRPVYAYTVEEIADGVDLYTKAMKTRAPKRGGDA